MSDNGTGHAMLTGGRRLAKNTLWNLLGQGLPLLVGLATIPLLIDGLGIERFGILALAWMVIGYFSLFDVGLGRALTKLVAEKLGAGRDQEIPELIWTALVLMGVLGLVGAAVLAALSPWLVQGVLNIPAAYRGETLRAFYLLALSIPLVVGTTGLRGVLEAHQRFGLVNAVRIPMGIWTFLGPLVVLPFSKSLFAVVAVLMVGRLIAWIVHMWLCLRVVPALRHGKMVRRAMIGPLLSFGGWMTVSNIVGPMMVYFDRFLIGALVSVSAVAYYVTPYEVVTRLKLIPYALVGVLFPAFANTFVKDSARAARLFGRGVNYVFLALFPLILVIVVLAAEALNLWLGPVFAQNSTWVLQWLAVGVFINSLAHVPSALIQGAGRPDLTAKLHLMELPVYLLAVWWMIGAYGIEGAAIAWVARVALDMLFLFAMAQRILPASKPFVVRTTVILAVALPILAIGGLMAGFKLKAGFLLVALLVFAPTAWFLMLGPEDRTYLRNRFKFIPGFSATPPGR